MQIFAHFSIGKHKILNLFECLIDQFDNIILILMCILSAYGYTLVIKYYMSLMSLLGRMIWSFKYTNNGILKQLLLLVIISYNFG